MRLLGAFVCGNAKLTQSVVDSGALDMLPKLMGHPNKKIRKDVCWVISNIAAGTQLQLEALVLKNYLPRLIAVFKEDEPEIKKEVIWAICNMSLLEKPELIQYIFENKILEVICQIIKHSDPKIIAVGIESLNNLLNYGRMYPNELGKNPVLEKIELLGMFDTLEMLQHHPIQIVYEKTLSLLEKHFELE